MERSWQGCYCKYMLNYSELKKGKSNLFEKNGPVTFLTFLYKCLEFAKYPWLIIKIKISSKLLYWQYSLFLGTFC